MILAGSIANPQQIPRRSDCHRKTRRLCVVFCAASRDKPANAGGGVGASQRHHTSACSAVTKKSTNLFASCVVRFSLFCRDGGAPPCRTQRAQSGESHHAEARSAPRNAWRQPDSNTGARGHGDTVVYRVRPRVSVPLCHRVQAPPFALFAASRATFSPFPPLRLCLLAPLR